MEVNLAAYRLAKQTYLDVDTCYALMMDNIYEMTEKRLEAVGGLIRQSARGDPSSRFVQGSQDQELDGNTGDAGFIQVRAAGA